MVRRGLRRARAEFRRLTGRAGRLRAALDGSRAAVLNYHRVLPADEARRLVVEPGMYVTPATLAAHVAWLCAELRVLPLGEIAERLAGGQALPPGACALTFDDGWRDNHDHALPVLERHGVQATLFVVTERVGTRGAFWPDAVLRALAPLRRARQEELAASIGARGAGEPGQRILHALKALPEAERAAAVARLLEAAGSAADASPEREILDWDEVARMATAGVAIEAHGLSHALLTALPPERAEHELRSCRAQLQERGYGREALLAYPSGAYGPATLRLAREAGYRAAVTTESGLVHAGLDPLAWPRVALHEDVSASRAELLERFPVS